MRLDVDAEDLVAGIAILVIIVLCGAVYLGVGAIIASLLRLEGIAYGAMLIAWPFIIAIAYGALLLVVGMTLALFGSRGES